MANPSDEPPYPELVEKAPIGIFEVNQAGEYVNVNESGCELVGYTEDELLELSISDLIQTGDEPHEVPSFTELSETGHMRYAGKILHKDGSEVDVILDAVALENRGDVAYVQDNTAQKEYERELQDAKIRFQSLFEKAPEGIVIHGSNGDILEVNQQEIENLGYSRADLRSMNIADIEAGLSQEESQALWDQMDVGDTHKVETELERNDGSTYPVEVWANKIDINRDLRFLAFAFVRIGSLPDGFYVEDNGPGIPENERAEVFETGYSKNPNGKGFGLSIVQTIVEAHGWDIRLTESSEGGARSEFTGVEFAAD
jgi:PAS domain S-box-containing protein